MKNCPFCNSELQFSYCPKDHGSWDPNESFYWFEQVIENKKYYFESYLNHSQLDLKITFLSGQYKYKKIILLNYYIPFNINLIEKLLKLKAFS